MNSLAAPPPPKIRLRWRTRLVLFLLGLVLPYFAAQVVVAHVFTQRSARPIAFEPNQLPPGTEAVSFNSTDGLRLSAWYCSPLNSPASAPPHAVILVHGHFGDRRQMLPRARMLHRLGYAVLLYDARAHGESDGTRTSIGYHEKHDLLGAFAYLQSRGHTDIGAIGMSMGAATLALAAEDLPVMRWAVLESCYSSLEETFDARCRAWCGLSRTLIAPLVLPIARQLVDLPSNLLTPIEAAKQFRCPVLVLSGANDPFITPAQTQALYNAIPTRKAMHLTPNAGHVDLHSREPDAYETRLVTFLKQ